MSYPQEYEELFTRAAQGDTIPIQCDDAKDLQRRRAKLWNFLRREMLRNPQAIYCTCSPRISIRSDGRTLYVTTKRDVGSDPKVRAALDIVPETVEVH